MTLNRDNMNGDSKNNTWPWFFDRLGIMTNKIDPVRPAVRNKQVEPLAPHAEGWSSASTCGILLFLGPLLLLNAVLAQAGPLYLPGMPVAEKDTEKRQRAERQLLSKRDVDCKRIHNRILTRDVKEKRLIRPRGGLVGRVISRAVGRQRG